MRMHWTTSLGAAAASLILVVAAATTIAPLHAQMPVMSISVGPTIASRETNGLAFETDPMAAMGGGGGFRFGTGMFSVQPEVLIISKGTKRPNDFSEERLLLDYIEFPLLGIVTAMRDRKVRPFLGAGPVLSLEMRCRVQFVEENSKEEVGCDLPNASTFDRSKVDYGVAGLAGIDYALSPTRRLSLQARYTHGFRNISDSDDGTLEIRNRALSFFVSYSFPLSPDM